MSRRHVIMLVDLIAFTSFVLLTTTGILLHFQLPAGSGRFMDIWGMSRHEWGLWHYWIALVFFSVLSLHLILHWKAILTMVKGHIPEDNKWRIVFGFIGLLTVIILASAPLFSPTNIDEQPRGRYHQQQQK